MKALLLITFICISNVCISQTDLSSVFNGTFTHISMVDFSKTEIVIIDNSKLKLVNKGDNVVEEYNYYKTDVVNTYRFERNGNSFNAKLYLEQSDENTKVYALMLRNRLVFRKIIDK